MRLLLVVGALVWGALALTVFATPLAASAITRGSESVWLWYALTESGGYLGSTVIVLVTGAWLVWRTAGPFGRRIAASATLILLLGGILVGVATLNERVVKRNLDVPRPSHLLLKRRGVIDGRLADFYHRSRADRRRLIAHRLVVRRATVADIEPIVLRHWNAEVGRSFPSGHALNAFLLAGLLAALGSIFGVRPSIAAIGFVWAGLVGASRVALGVHGPLDVTIGAFAGGAIAALLVASGAWRWLLLRLFPRTVDAN
ncbi:MAG: phosphatase PAP2 family protein [Myxococcales bacterium]|nr:phosphatase PAP2 family protein [Myxococcales bacterium]